MPRLKRRFRWFNKALSLYPRTYYRRYAMQILQTLADMLDEPGLSATAKLRLRGKAWLDLFAAIPVQHLRSYRDRLRRRPIKTLFRTLIAGLLLLSPLIVIVFILPLLPGSTYYRYPLVYDPPLMVVWGIGLPLLTTGLIAFALHSLLTIRLTTSKKRRFLRVRSYSLAAVMVLLVVALDYAIVTQVGLLVSSDRTIAQDSRRSNEYQSRHPTLACRLLPLADAQRLVGDTSIRLDNAHSPTSALYSGIGQNDHDVRRTECLYIGRDFASSGASVQVSQAFSEAGRQRLHSDFNNVATNYGVADSTLTILGYPGYYFSSYQHFDLSLWVKDYWLDVTTQNFDNSVAAMQLMIANLNKEIAAQAATQAEADQRRIVPVPVTADILSNADQIQIGSVLAGRQLPPAGTTYNLKCNTIAGTQVTGTISYSTNIKANFTVQKSGSNCEIVSYRLQ